jgi:hypothetical protein
LKITHSRSRSLRGPHDTLTALVAEVAAADHGLVLILDPNPVDLAFCQVCQFCDPTGPTGAVAATITAINRLDHPIQRSLCSLCVHDAVVWATSEGRDVTIRAAVGSVQ